MERSHVLQRKLRLGTNYDTTGSEFIVSERTVYRKEGIFKPRHTEKKKKRLYTDQSVWPEAYRSLALCSS